MNIFQQWKLHVLLLLMLFFPASNSLSAVHHGDIQAIQVLASLALLPVGVFNFHLSTMETNHENENTVRTTKALSNVLVDVLRIVNASCALYNQKDIAIYTVPWLFRDVQKLYQDLQSLRSTRKNLEEFRKNQKVCSFNSAACIFLLLEAESVLRAYLAGNNSAGLEDPNARSFFNGVVSLMRLCQEALNAKNDKAQKTLSVLIAIHACFSIKEYINYLKVDITLRQTAIAENPSGATVLQQVVNNLVEPEISEQTILEDFALRDHFRDNNTKLSNVRPYPNHIKDVANNSGGEAPYHQPISHAEFDQGQRNNIRNEVRDRYFNHTDSIHRYRNNPTTIREGLVDSAGEIAGQVAERLAARAAGRLNRWNNENEVPFFGYSDPISQHIRQNPCFESHDTCGMDRAHSRHLALQRAGIPAQNIRRPQESILAGSRAFDDIKQPFSESYDTAGMDRALGRALKRQFEQKLQKKIGHKFFNDK